MIDIPDATPSHYISPYYEETLRDQERKLHPGHPIPEWGDDSSHKHHPDDPVNPTIGKKEISGSGSLNMDRLKDRGHWQVWSDNCALFDQFGPAAGHRSMGEANCWTDGDPKCSLWGRWYGEDEENDSSVITSSNTCRFDIDGNTGNEDICDEYDNYSKNDSKCTVENCPSGCTYFKKKPRCIPDLDNYPPHSRTAALPEYCQKIKPSIAIDLGMVDEYNNPLDKKFDETALLYPESQEECRRGCKWETGQPFCINTLTDGAQGPDNFRLPTDREGRVHEFYVPANIDYFNDDDNVVPLSQKKRWMRDDWNNPQSMSSDQGNTYGHDKGDCDDNSSHYKVEIKNRPFEIGKANWDEGEKWVLERDISQSHLDEAMECLNKHYPITCQSGTDSDNELNQIAYEWCKERGLSCNHGDKQAFSPCPELQGFCSSNDPELLNYCTSIPQTDRPDSTTAAGISDYPRVSLCELGFRGTCYPDPQLDVSGGNKEGGFKTYHEMDIDKIKITDNKITLKSILPSDLNIYSSDSFGPEISSILRFDHAKGESCPLKDISFRVNRNSREYVTDGHPRSVIETDSLNEVLNKEQMENCKNWVTWESFTEEDGLVDTCTEEFIECRNKTQCMDELYKELNGEEVVTPGGELEALKRCIISKSAPSCGCVLIHEDYDFYREGGAPYLFKPFSGDQACNICAPKKRVDDENICMVSSSDCLDNDDCQLLDLRNNAPPYCYREPGGREYKDIRIYRPPEHSHPNWDWMYEYNNLVSDKCIAKNYNLQPFCDEVSNHLEEYNYDCNSIVKGVLEGDISTEHEITPTDEDDIMGPFKYNGEVYQPLDACKFHGNNEGVTWKPPGNALINYIKQGGIDIPKGAGPSSEQSTDTHNTFKLNPECHRNNGSLIGASSEDLCYVTGFADKDSGPIQDHCGFYDNEVSLKALKYLKRRYCPGTDTCIYSREENLHHKYNIECYTHDGSNQDELCRVSRVDDDGEKKITCTTTDSSTEIQCLPTIIEEIKSTICNVLNINKDGNRDIIDECDKRISEEDLKRLHTTTPHPELWFNFINMVNAGLDVEEKKAALNSKMEYEDDIWDILVTKYGKIKKRTVCGTLYHPTDIDGTVPDSRLILPVIGNFKTCTGGPDCFTIFDNLSKRVEGKDLPICLSKSEENADHVERCSHIIGEALHDDQECKNVLSEDGTQICTYVSIDEKSMCPEDICEYKESESLEDNHVRITEEELKLYQQIYEPQKYGGICPPDLTRFTECNLYGRGECKEVINSGCEDVDGIYNAENIVNDNLQFENILNKTKITYGPYMGKIGWMIMNSEDQVLAFNELRQQEIVESIDNSSNSVTIKWNNHNRSDHTILPGDKMTLVEANGTPCNRWEGIELEVESVQLPEHPNCNDNDNDNDNDNNRSCCTSFSWPSLESHQNGLPPTEVEIHRHNQDELNHRRAWEQDLNCVSKITFKDNGAPGMVLPELNFDRCFLRHVEDNNKWESSDSKELCVGGWLNPDTLTVIDK